jgi:ParB family chromosome partitioning protein
MLWILQMTSHQAVLNASPSPDAEAFDTSIFPANIKATMGAADANSSDLYKVPVDQLRVLPGFNVRIKDASYHAHIRQLADSIKSNGFFTHRPIAGYAALERGRNVIYVTDGHCRLEAAILAISEGAPIERLPVVMASKGTSTEDLTYELLTTSIGKSLSPLEEAIAIKRLIRYGHDPKSIAARLACTVAKIEDRLLFISMPKTVLDMVNDGKVSYTNAIALFRQHGSLVEKKLLDLASEREAQISADPGKKKSKRVMPAQDPAQALRKALTKHQGSMFEALQTVLSDPSFKTLDSSAQHRVDMVIRHVKNAVPQDASTPTSTSTNVVSIPRAA